MQPFELLFSQNIFIVYLFCSRHSARRNGYQDEQSEVRQKDDKNIQLPPQLIIAHVTEGAKSQYSSQTVEGTRNW